MWVSYSFCDNHPVNRSFFKVLSNNQINEAIDNPAEPGSKLFLLLDPTHTIKNIYNNLQKSKAKKIAFIKDETNIFRYKVIV